MGAIFIQTTTYSGFSQQKHLLAVDATEGYVLLGVMDVHCSVGFMGIYIGKNLPNFTLDVKYLFMECSSLRQSRKHMPLTWFFSDMLEVKVQALMTTDEASLLLHPFSDIY